MGCSLSVESLIIRCMRRFILPILFSLIMILFFSCSGVFPDRPEDPLQLSISIDDRLSYDSALAKTARTISYGRDIEAYRITVAEGSMVIADTGWQPAGMDEYRIDGILPGTYVISVHGGVYDDSGSVHEVAMSSEERRVEENSSIELTLEDVAPGSAGALSITAYIPEDFSELDKMLSSIRISYEDGISVESSLESLSIEEGRDSTGRRYIAIGSSDGFSYPAGKGRVECSLSYIPITSDAAMMAVGHSVLIAYCGLPAEGIIDMGIGQEIEISLDSESYSFVSQRNPIYLEAAGIVTIGDVDITGDLQEPLVWSAADPSVLQIKPVEGHPMMDVVELDPLKGDTQTTVSVSYAGKTATAAVEIQRSETLELRLSVASADFEGTDADEDVSITASLYDIENSRAFTDYQEIPFVWKIGDGTIAESTVSGTADASGVISGLRYGFTDLTVSWDDLSITIPVNVRSVSIQCTNWGGGVGINVSSKASLEDYLTGESLSFAEVIEAEGLSAGTACDWNWSYAISSSASGTYDENGSAMGIYPIYGYPIAPDLSSIEFGPYRATSNSYTYCTD